METFPVVLADVTNFPKCGIGCKSCEFVASNDGDLDDHMRDSHGKMRIAAAAVGRRMRPKDSPPPPPPRVFMCEKCDYRGTRMHHLRLHMKRHLATADERADLKCGSCDYATGDPSNLRRHKRQVHDRALTFQCLDCDPPFKTSIKRDLARHARTRRHMTTVKENKHNSSNNNNNNNNEEKLLRKEPLTVTLLPPPVVVALPIKQGHPFPHGEYVGEVCATTEPSASVEVPSSSAPQPASMMDLGQEDDFVSELELPEQRSDAEILMVDLTHLNLDDVLSLASELGMGEVWAVEAPRKCNAAAAEDQRARNSAEDPLHIPTHHIPSFYSGDQ